MFWIKLLPVLFKTEWKNKQYRYQKFIEIHGQIKANYYYTYRTCITKDKSRFVYLYCMDFVVASGAWVLLQYSIAIKTHLKLKVRTIPFIQKIYFIYKIILTICAKHGSENTVHFENIKTVLEISNQLLAEEISRDRSLKYILDPYPILQRHSGFH